MKRAFTLIEMLIVIGIIAVLTAASLAGFSSMRKSAERAKARELCLQVKTALEAIWNADGVWPKKLREKSSGADSKLDDEAAYVLASRGMLTLTHSGGRVTGLDRFGIVTPWATEVIKRTGSSSSLSTPVGKATIQDHILRFKLDLDGDGIIDGANIGGESIDIRATAAVWCCGKDGKMETYKKGLKSDDIYTWTPGQTKNVK